MSETTENAAPEPAGTSRRTLLKGAAVGAGALWAAPAVLTFAADPAAASPAGCNICLPPANALVPTAVGNGTSLAAWTNQTNIQAAVGVFRTTTRNAGPGSAQYTPADFSSACTTRFGTQTPVNLTLAASIGAGTTGTSVTVEFYSTPGGTGTLLPGSITISRSLTTASVVSQSGPIPAGTVSLRVTMTTGARALGGPVRGRIDNITLTVGTC